MEKYLNTEITRRPSTLLVAGSLQGDADPVASVDLSRRAYKNVISEKKRVEINGGINGFKLQPELFENK